MWLNLFHHAKCYRAKFTRALTFLPFSTDEDYKREGMVLPCGIPEGDHGKHLLMTTLSSQERDSNETVEEGTEEMKPSLFSADASSSQHRW
jgi:hypothetical protein